MKATIDIPDSIYRRVKAKSAMEGRAVREVAVALFQGWIGEDARLPASATAGGSASRPAWFAAARPYARRVARHDMASVRRSIAAGRRDAVAAPATGKEQP
jgi:hypothetical protein